MWEVETDICRLQLPEFIPHLFKGVLTRGQTTVSIEIIGKAAYKLTRTFCSEHAETPWEFIAKMRHVLVHDYYQIDPDAVFVPRPGISKTLRVFRKRRRLLDKNRRVLTKKLRLSLMDD